MLPWRTHSCVQRPHSWGRMFRQPARSRTAEKSRSRECVRHTRLLQIRAQGVNQIVGRLSLLIGRVSLRIENVKADVPLDYLSH